LIGGSLSEHRGMFHELVDQVVVAGNKVAIGRIKLEREKLEADTEASQQMEAMRNKAATERIELERKKLEADIKASQQAA